MPKNRKMQNIIGTEHITDVAEAAIAAQATASDIVGDTTPQLGGNLDVNGNDIVSVSNGDIELNPNGTGQVIFKGNATKGAGQFKLNCEQNSHGIVIKGPPHSAAASYTLTLPNTDGSANEVLKTDGSGNLDWVAQSGGGGVTIQDEGSALSTTGTTLNFVGSGVVASGTGATKTITIAGGSGGSGYMQAVTNWPNFGTNVLVFVPSANPPLSMNVLTVGSNTLSDDIQFAPWLFRQDTTIKEIGFRMSGTSNPAEMCVYESNSDGFPTNKVANSTATFASPTSGTNMATMAAGSSGITFTANELYWCAITNTTTGANLTLTTHGTAGSVVGMPGGIYNRSTLQLVSGTVNALPASIGTLSVSAGYQAFMAFAKKA